MILVEINTVTYGSTGRIMRDLACLVKNTGGTAMTCVPGGRHYRPESETADLVLGGRITEDFHIAIGALSGLQGCFSAIATHRLINRLKEISPDIIHLHNLHQSYINLPLLFRYIKKHNIKVVWTLHDCWSFTGHCPHFDMAGCDKWKNGCEKCPQYREYPQSLVDNSRYMYKLKKKWFTGVEDMTLVTPSQWLADRVKQSFLKDYPVKVINNGIDLTVFKPTESDFRTKYACEDKKIVLGVAFGWTEKKGLDVFAELAGRLDDSYKIVLVGTSESSEQKLPDSVIKIRRTENQQQLAEIYSAADVFVNPTREEVFGLVNVEALACGTPVVTFNTGGSPETLDNTCGSVVEKNDIDALESEIVRICSDSPYSSESCVVRASGFDMNERYDEYINLYRSILG